MDELTVGELSARSGVAVSALHFYEKKGLITSRRTSGNQRRYRRDTLRRVALVRIGQRVGIPLAEIAAVLATLPDGRTPTRHDWLELARQWQERLDDRIRDLQHLRDDFGDCIGCGCLSLDRCPLANPGDEMGREGPGPRRLSTRADCFRSSQRPRPRRSGDRVCEVVTTSARSAGGAQLGAVGASRCGVQRVGATAPAAPGR